jgi:hypothetical protein
MIDSAPANQQKPTAISVTDGTPKQEKRKVDLNLTMLGDENDYYDAEEDTLQNITLTHPSVHLTADGYQLSPSLFSNNEGQSSATKQPGPSDRDIMQMLEDMPFLSAEIGNEVKASDQGVIFSPKKSKHVIGTVSDIEPIVKKLLFSEKTTGKRKFPELSDSINKIINDKFISKMSEASQEDAQHMFPNLRVPSVDHKRTSRTQSVSPKRRIRSPVRTRSVVRKRDSKQSGLGRILKINFNKWNQLLS